MKCVILATVLATVVGVLYSNPAHGFISIRSSQNGAAVRWGEGAGLTFRTNTTNRSGLMPNDILSMFTTSLSRWKQAANQAFGFTYFQGTDTARYPNYLNSPQDNTIFFTSNAANSSDRLSCGVIALTQVWFDPSSGIASKADLRFNDNCYRFTTNPSDTISLTNIYLGDVATHELGHALGLDHSQNLQSSMVYTAYLEMSHPACDDQSAMAELYSSGLRSRTGAITGRVQTSGGTAVFGAHVTAIELERGIAVTSAISDKDGTFRVAGLETGTYSLVVEPFYPGSSSLGPYYAQINSSVCSGAAFQRTFVTSGGAMSAFSVTPGSQVGAGTISVSCSASTSINAFNERNTSTAPLLAAASITSPIASQSVFTSGSDHYYRLNAQTGILVANALAHTLFSRSDVQVEFLNSAGSRMVQSVYGDVFAGGASNYVNYDAQASVNLGTTPQDIFIHVFTRATLSNSSFPSSSIGVSSTPYYILAVSRGITPQQNLFAASNARCETPDSFGPYTLSGEAGAFSGGTKSSDDDKGSTGCGTIQDINGGSGGGPGSMFRLVNFMGMLMMVSIAIRRMKTAHSL